MWQLVTGIFITVVFLKFMFGDSLDKLILEILDVFEVLFKLVLLWLVVSMISSHVAGLNL